MQDPQLD